MKKQFFFFAMLVGITASAQSHINIQMISATYTGSPAVKFRVSWSSVPTVTGQTHNAKIWVWVDFLKINADNTTSGNTWTRAEITATPAVSSSPTSTATLEAGNNKGFWLNGVTGSYSATITASLTNIPANTKFNWCAYTSDCPPNVTLDKGTYTFKGTTNFVVSSHAQPLTSKTIARTSLTVNSSSTFTDATGCPGIGQFYCPYTGSDLYMDLTHLCQQRTSGAKNWEAYIKDSRDNQIYRIVLMPDNKWWLAQNVKYVGTNIGIVNSTTGCTPDKCGRLYTGAQMSSTYTGSTGASGYGANKQGICPNGWILPVYTNWRTFVDAIHTVSYTQYNVGNGIWFVGSSNIINERLAAYNNPFKNGNNWYGWANGNSAGVETDPTRECWRSNASQTCDWGLILCHQAGDGYSGYPSLTLSQSTNSSDRRSPVRCLRQL